MMTILGKSILSRFDQGTQYEWLETNGLGGYASSTVLGAQTRRYHGLLVAATKPPVNRVVMLSKLDEIIHVNGHHYELGANKYRGTVSPNGYIFLQGFQQDPFPSFTYQLPGVKLQKTITAIHGEHTTLVTYEVLEAGGEFTMELMPMYAPRDYHHLSHANEEISHEMVQEGNVFCTQPYADQPNLYFQIEGAHFEANPNWYFHLEYQEELARGMEGHEDLFVPGSFYLRLRQGSKVGIIVSTAHPQGRDAFALQEQERQRREQVVKEAGFEHPMLKRLSRAADQFVVQRNQDLKTIIAGYPWFTDWGRDTMIALPGLCLATGRQQDARKILLAFARAVDQGMIPNRFPDNGEAPIYNTIDGTLWFFIAVFKYWQHTQDLPFVAGHLLPVLGDILNWHERGTRYDIHMDHDGLLTGGAEGYALTWMDAKAGDWVVTPRRGKAVEINALWYNAWRVFGHLLRETHQVGQAEMADQQAERIRKAFIAQFWNPHTLCLYDLIDGDHKCDAIRPNQIFAISLPFALLDIDQAYQVLDRVERELLTPYGLRSLSPSHHDYYPVYEGDQYQRDGAYHQGTVWSWLIGPYMDALIRVRGGWGRDMSRLIFERMETHLDEAGIGSISEIFDGNSPNTARGCFAQAWSIAELLRVAYEHDLYPKRDQVSRAIPVVQESPTNGKKRFATATEQVRVNQ